jgi:hypothetical protein
VASAPEPPANQDRDIFERLQAENPDGIQLKVHCALISRDPSESTPKIKRLLRLCHKPIFKSLHGRRSQHPSLMEPQLTKLLMEWIWVDISK